MKLEIKDRWEGKILYQDEAESLKALIEAAVKGGASLVRANLYGANLVRANLVRANLDGANLDGANLDGANLDGAHLDGAKGIKDVLSIGPIGSRKAYLMAILDDKDNITVQTGCFKGTLKQFEAKVKKTHPDDKHSQPYLIAIDLIKAWLVAKTVEA